MDSCGGLATTVHHAPTTHALSTANSLSPLPLIRSVDIQSGDEHILSNTHCYCAILMLRDRSISSFRTESA